MDKSASFDLSALASPISLVKERVPPKEPILLLGFTSPEVLRQQKRSEKPYSVLILLLFLLPWVLISVACWFSPQLNILSRAGGLVLTLVLAVVLIWGLKRGAPLSLRSLFCITSERLLRIDVRDCDQGPQVEELQWSAINDPLEGWPKGKRGATHLIDTIDVSFYAQYTGTDSSSNSYIQFDAVDRRTMWAATIFGSAAHYKKVRDSWYQSAVKMAARFPDDPHPKALLAFWCENDGALEEAKKWRTQALQGKESMHPELVKGLQAGSRRAWETGQLEKLALYDKSADFSQWPRVSVPQIANHDKD